MSEMRDFSVFVRPAADGRAAMDLAVEGIHCAACMRAIEKGLAAEPGVTGARVNLANRRVTVEWEPGRVDPGRILDRMDAIGFHAHPFTVGRAEDSERREEKRLLICLAVAGFAAMNIMLLSVSVWAGNVSDITPETRDFFHWLSALIALPAALYAGMPFFESAGRALRQRAVNMDVPISLGVLLALGMSVVETLNHAEHAYFDSAVMLLFFLLVGRYLERAMRRRTRAVATNLAALKAETAVKFVSETEIRTVPVAALAAGDLVLVRPGERIGVDGTVVEGRSEIDASLVTGETRPATVQAGADVYAGTLNLSGTIKVRVHSAEEGTLLAEVQRLLDKAAETRSRHVVLADRAARLYAPVVHLTALLTFLGWIVAGAGWHDALIIAITVLIITCPCALGLAIPAVQVVASGALFRTRILINSGDVLERLAEADTIAFDKTGTLTLPEASLLNAGAVEPGLVALAGRLALTSCHPLAAAIVAATGAAEPVPGATEEPGSGVRAVIDGTEAFLGKPEDARLAFEAGAVQQAHPSASLIAIRFGERGAVLAIGQRLRPDAVETVTALQRAGYRVLILSGDHAAAVSEAAVSLGVAEHAGGLKPADKIARLEALRAEGRRVMMVGDGLNDAPALAAAHVSLSPIDATHLAQVQADGVFIGAALAPVLAALRIGRRAKRIMIENLWLAVLYNAVAVPIAIAGLVTPLIAALAMSGSSILVTLNALRSGRAA
ncbi:MAG: heavy metal translocating P-type ATPase [Hyphomicrobiales bacterium]|nr:heavy metal translocating P-type ATPase [Hyphomicrobiales bacterium]